jgi:hypothetical protein
VLGFDGRELRIQLRQGTVTIVKAAVTITTTATTFAASVHAGRMTFISTVHDASSGAPVAGIAVKVSLKTAFGFVVTCTATTNALSAWPPARAATAPAADP